ncbi:hypothetical protein LUZ60_012788 [Juncus effusus]|nr:hypothetical protein LUZ60_012788 [Juncus effusus]
MWRETSFQRDEDPDQSLSDDEGLDELGYDNDCTDRLHSLYRHDKKALDNCGNEVGGSCSNAIGHLQSMLKEENHSDINDESISDEENLAVIENSLACNSTSKHEEKYNNNNYNNSNSNSNNSIKCKEEFSTSKWNQVLEASSELDYLPKKPINNRVKGKTKLKFSIHSNIEVKNENSSVGVMNTNNNNINALNDLVDLLEDFKEENNEINPSVNENIPFEKKGANPSMAELLEGLQGKNYSNMLEEKSKEKEGKKKILFNLGKRTLENEEDQPDSSSDNEDKYNNNLNLVMTQNLKEKRQTMSDLFQEAFNASNSDLTPVPANKFLSNYYARLQEVMQNEKEKNAQFLRLSHSKQTSFYDSGGITVQIMSRVLEGRLIVCDCLLQDNQNLSEEGEINGGTKMKKTVIFNSKICDNVDLVEGNSVRIFPPWKEVLVKEDEKIILCTYFSNHTDF